MFGLYQCPSPSSRLFFPLLQLYHVIWMNLHRDSPIWRRRGFRKCLKMTQQQAVSCLWELHWDKLDYKCGSVLVSQPDKELTSNPDMTRGVWSRWLIFKNLFMYFVFTFVLLFYSVFLVSVKVQTDSGLPFFIILNYYTLVFAVFCIFSLW